MLNQCDYYFYYSIHDGSADLGQINKGCEQNAVDPFCSIIGWGATDRVVPVAIRPARMATGIVSCVSAGQQAVPLIHTVASVQLSTEVTGTGSLLHGKRRDTVQRSILTTNVARDNGVSLGRYITHARILYRR
jgi:hypothetical protein